MFTEIDKVLYPNKCEVIQTTSHDFIYPIFKNGSSSLYQAAKDNNWKILINSQIKKCDKIKIFIRDPVERFKTGANAFVNHCLKKNLDKQTVVYFIENYLFLNRHYMPQIMWLMHLSRYTMSEVIIEFKELSQLNLYTEIQKNKSKIEENYSINTDKLKFYIEADNYLLNYVNSPISFYDLLINYKNDCKDGYKHIFLHAKNLIDALPKN